MPPLLRRPRWPLGLIVPLLLNACATSRAQPLSEGPDLRDRVPALSIDARTLPLPALRRHVFNPADGLDLTEDAMLAVVNNPDLKARHRKAGVAQAQVFAVRLLPEGRP